MCLIAIVRAPALAPGLARRGAAPISAGTDPVFHVRCDIKTSRIPFAAGFRAAATAACGTTSGAATTPESPGNEFLSRKERGKRGKKKKLLCQF